MDAKEVVNLIRERDIPVVDLRFCDLPGLWQHFTVVAGDVTEEAFAEGFGFDGSSIRGFQQIQESDMILFPDPTTAFEDPFTKVPGRQALTSSRRSVDAAVRRSSRIGWKSRLDVPLDRRPTAVLENDSPRPRLDSSAPR